MMRAAIGLVVLAVIAAALFLVPEDYYLWVKALHVIGVIAWMAGMLYLPRLFVYHADSERGSQQSETFKVMERRLLRAIINPAMTITWAAGLWLAWKIFHFEGGWLHTKIVMVVVMSGIHGYLSAAVRKFAEDHNEKPSRHWRIVNEIPTLLLIAIVILVVVKPF
jgi:putative membrane protein